jgi:hypothetical protein
MSPEQASGQSLDSRSDLFSLGTCVYEMLTAKRPFEGESELKTLELIRTGEFLSPGDHRPDIPSETLAMVKQLLQRSPSDRYPSADEVQRAALSILVEAGTVVSSTDLREFMKPVFESARNTSAITLDDVLNEQLDAMISKTPDGAGTQMAQRVEKMGLQDTLEQPITNSRADGRVTTSRAQLAAVADASMPTASRNRILLVSLVLLIGVLVSFNVIFMVQSAKNQNAPDRDPTNPVSTLENETRPAVPESAVESADDPAALLSPPVEAAAAAERVAGEGESQEGRVGSSDSPSVGDTPTPVVQGEAGRVSTVDPATSSEVPVAPGSSDNADAVVAAAASSAGAEASHVEEETPASAPVEPTGDGSAREDGPSNAASDASGPVDPGSVVADEHIMTLRIEDLPEGATVSIRGKTVDTSGVYRIPSIEGEQTVGVRVAAPGHEDLAREFQWAPGADVSIEKLTAERKRIRVRTQPPAAQILVGGRAVGTGSHSVVVAAGSSVRVRAELDGYESGSVVLHHNSPATRVIRLQPSEFGRYEVRVYPVNARVEVDGRVVARTAGLVTGRIAPGQHRLTLSHGESRRSVSFTVRSGEVRKLGHFDLAEP